MNATTHPHTILLSSYPTLCVFTMLAGLGGCVIEAEGGLGGFGRPTGSPVLEQARPETTTQSLDPDAPRIVDLSTNTLSLTEGQTLVLSALVSDPQGPQDIIGGKLMSADTGRSYGAFVPLDHGIYEIEIDWDELHHVESIEFEGEALRRMSAVFYDQAGLGTIREVAIVLRCEDTGVACGGQCVDLDREPDHCGACERSCRAVGPEPVCQAGTCRPALGTCLGPEHGFRTCADYCESIQEICAPRMCRGATWVEWDQGHADACSDEQVGGQISTQGCYEPLAAGDASLIRCCCTDNTT